MNLLTYAQQRSNGVKVYLTAAAFSAVCLSAVAQNTTTLPLTKELEVKFVPVPAPMVQFIPIKPKAHWVEELNDDALLRAIRERETGNRWDGPPGKLGELGAYQFRKETWMELSKEPHSSARNPKIGNKVAGMFLNKIKDAYERHGIPITAYNCALAWNGGISSVVSNRVTPAAKNYAQAVHNLTGAFLKDTSTER
jgi:hypothetical protein